MVLKSSGEVGLDLFITELSRRCGVKIPAMRYMRWTEEEMVVMKAELLRCSRRDEVMNYRLQKKLKLAFVQVLEYVPGWPLSRLGVERAKEVYEVGSAEGRARMAGLGMIYALDVFLNNSDRYPLSLWKNEGNVENCILRSVAGKADHFYAIDARIIIQAEGNQELQNNILAQYREKVRQFLEQMLREVEAGSIQCFSEFEKIVHDNTLLLLSQDCLRYLVHGFVTLMGRICDLGLPGIVQLRDSLLIDDAKDYMHNFNGSLRKLKLDYYQDMLTLFSQVLDANKQPLHHLRKSVQQ